MTAPRAAWGTFQAVRKVLALVQETHYFRTDRRAEAPRGQVAEMLTQQHQHTLHCVPSLLVDLGKVTFLLPMLSPIPLFVHFSHLDWKIFSCDYDHVFLCLRISFCAKSKEILGEIFLFLGKKKNLRNSIFCSISSNAFVGKKESNVFSLPKEVQKGMFFSWKTENAGLGGLVRQLPVIEIFWGKYCSG